MYLVKVKDNDKLVAKYVYRDDILLESTKSVLKDKDVIYEQDYKLIGENIF